MHISKILFRTTAVIAWCAVPYALPTTAIADDFVISVPTAVENGGNTIDGNDTLTITETGSIIIPGAGQNGVEFTGTFNVITNNGTISVPDIAGHNGIVTFDNNNTVINNGTIISGRDGIELDGTNSTVINNGTITITGVAFGGGDARGIRILSGTVLNTGTVAITGTGGNAGIVGDNGSTIENTGFVFTTGAAAEAITAGLTTHTITVTNSGSIVSVQTRSIQMGANGTLNLLAPGFLGGVIDLETNTTVNVTSGPSHSVLWDLSTGGMNGGAPNLSGPVPIFYNAGTQQVATFDESGMAGGAQTLADLTGSLSQLTAGRLSTPTGAPIGSYNAPAFFPAQSPSATEERMEQAFTGTYSPAIRQAGFWASAFGGVGDYDANANALDQEATLAGFAIGYDQPYNEDITLGGFLGYSWSELDVDSRFAASFDNETDGFFAGVYGQARMGHAFVNLGLSGGLLSHDDNRFVNDNLAALGNSFALASYDSWWLSPELTIGAGYEVSAGWTATPSVQFRYTFQSVDGYTETGPSAANATVASRDVSILNARAQLEIARSFGQASLSARVGWQHRESFGDDATVTLIGQTQSVGYDADSSSAFVGLGASLQVSETVSLALGGEAVFGSTQSLSGNATLSIAF